MATNKTLRKLIVKFHKLFRDIAHDEYVNRVKSIYSIHPSFRIGYGTIISGNGSIEIGEDSYIGNNSFVTAEPADAKIIIGKHCSLSHNIHIRTQQHVKKKFYKDVLTSPIMGADITVGDYVWIGANVYVSGGVVIGENSIVGANSVVTHDIPSNSVYGGVPARLLSHKFDYPD